MAGFASVLELAAMGIFALVAAGAVLGQLLSGHGGRVAGVAIDLGVGAHQRKFMTPGMVVVLQRPVVIVMAIAALLAETGRMGVVCLMATVAVLGNLVLVIAAPM